jgi:hypothetical protein
MAELQGRQCTYNVTLRRVLETSVAVEKQQVLHILILDFHRGLKTDSWFLEILYGVRGEFPDDVSEPTAVPATSSGKFTSYTVQNP